MRTIYIIYWFIHDGAKKKMASKEFNSMESAEAFASEKLTDCTYTIRKIEEAQ